MVKAGASVLSKSPSSGDNGVDKAVGELRRVIDGMRSPLSGARILEDVELTSGTTARIPHGLGRRLRGWIVVRTNEGATLGSLHDEQADHTDTAKFLYLRAEGYSPTVSLLVF